MAQKASSYVKAFQCKKTETPEACEIRKAERVAALIAEGKLEDDLTAVAPVVEQK